MNVPFTFASAPDQAAWPGNPAGQPNRHYSLASLRSAVAAWRERNHFRLELRRMAKDNPHLIDDIGLTRRQVEAELARLPFWQR